VDFSTSKNHWPAFRERNSVQLKKEASSYCLDGKALLTLVVRLSVRSLMRKGTPSTLEDEKQSLLFLRSVFTAHNAYRVIIQDLQCKTQAECVDNRFTFLYSVQQDV